MKEDFSGRGKDAHIIMMICLRNSLLLDVISQVSYDNVMNVGCIGETNKVHMKRIQAAWSEID